MIHPPMIAGSGGKQKVKAQANTSTTTTTPKEANNTLRSSSTIRVIDLLCEGPIYGFPDSTYPSGMGQSIFFDGTSIYNSDHGPRYDGLFFDFRGGWPNQPYLSGFSDVESIISVGAEITFPSPLVQTTTSADVTAARITISVDQFFSVEAGTANYNYEKVDFQIWVKPSNAGYSLARYVTITGKTRSRYDADFYVNLAQFGTGPYEIRLVRLTHDGDGREYFTRTWWAYTTEIIDAKQTYSDSAVVAFHVDAQYFGSSIPSRSYLIQGLYVAIPSNYDPITRVYSGIWDGTWAYWWSDNPAWCLLDLLTNTRYGFGYPLAKIDTAALYTIAQYCDQWVPDGKGGYEPRFTFNCVLQKREEAMSVLAAICSNFWGMAYPSSGGITFSQDAPADPVMLVTPANVIGGQFTYSGSALKDRHSVAQVSWNNPALNYEQDIEIVEDYDAVTRYGYNTIEVQAIGCTSQGQAHRYGKYILDTERTATQTITYRAGMDHAWVQPGNIVSVADPTIANVRMGGRIKDIIIGGRWASITLDAAVTLDPGVSYSMSNLYPASDDPGYRVQTAPIVSAAGTTDSITVDGLNWAGIPSVGDLYVVTSPAAVAPREFRIVSKREVEPITFEFVGLIHDPTKYARIEYDIQLPVPSYSNYPTGPIGTPTELVLSDYVYVQDGKTYSGATLSWHVSPKDPRIAYYSVWRYDKNRGTWLDYGPSQNQSIDIRPIEPGWYMFMVAAWSYQGVGSNWGTVEQIVWGKLTRPADVTSFSCNIIGTICELAWTPVADLDVSIYRIRYSPATVGADWRESTDIGTFSGTRAQVGARTGTYFIKAVDDGGRESINALAVVTNISEIYGLNFIDSITEAPAFGGTFTGTAIDGDGYVVISGTTLLSEVATVSAIAKFSTLDGGLATDGTYQLADTIDVGGYYTSRISSFLTTSAIDYSDLMSTWPSVAGRTAWSDGELDHVDVQCYLRCRSDVLLPYTDWIPFTVGDFAARYFQFQVRLTSTQAYTTPIVQQIDIAIDMPDRSAGASDVVSSASGNTAITFSPAFHATPEVAVSGQNMATGDFFLISSKSATGFTVNFYNSVGTRISRTFDWIAKGYGYLI